MTTPVTQKTEAIKTRRLKKADFEVDFVFINEVESFPSAVKPQTVPATLGEMAEVCQGLFFKYSDADFRELARKKKANFHRRLSAFAGGGAAGHAW